MPWSAKMIVMTVSVIVTACAVLCGVLLGDVLPEFAARIVGAVLLAAVGLYVAVGGDSKKSQHNPQKKSKNALTVSAEILSNSAECDIDRSGVLDHIEAVLVGLALSADSFGAGIGAGVAGRAAFAVPLVCGVFQTIFLCIGEQFARKIGSIKPVRQKYLNLLSGSIMVITAVLRLVF